MCVTDIGPKIQYFLLCDSLPEEKSLREDLQRQRLVSITLWIFLFEILWLVRGKFRPFKWQVSVSDHVNGIKKFNLYLITYTCLWRRVWLNG